MMSNEEQAKKFLEVVSNNYDDCLKKWRKYQTDKNMEFDDDVFQDTILKIYDKIMRSGIQEDTEQGMLNYFFKSFQRNTRREFQYSRNAYRDKNCDVFSLLEAVDNGDEEIENKRKQEAWSQFVAYNILKIVEENFDDITFRCFRIYYMMKEMPYAKLTQVTNVRNAKKRVVDVKKWLQTNVDKSLLLKQFAEWYEENNDLIW